MPISFIILAPMGVITLILGGWAMTGGLISVHPMLNTEGGLALVVSGVALLLSAAFPLVLRRLALAEVRKD